MGMTLLQAQQRLHEKWMELTKDGTDEEMMQALSIADQVLGSYDESLKTDMVAMLTEIKLEIVEKIVGDVEYNALSTLELKYTCEVINKKIKELKESKDE